MQRVSAICLSFLLVGCETSQSPLAGGVNSYQTFPAPVPGKAARDYLIGPLDVINVTVFQEPDLTVRDVQVDSGGNVLLPLVGEIKAAGLSTSDFSQALARRLSVRYLENPQVSVGIASSASQRVTVEGSVTDPGVFDIRGPTTLLDALALAKGPTRVARLDQVVIFRDINGQRQGALFDVAQIRSGQMPDPEVLGDDTVVVGLSHVKAAWRDVLTAVPLLAIFRPFG